VEELVVVQEVGPLTLRGFTKPVSAVDVVRLKPAS
jgi:hypothetical protein